MRSATLLGWFMLLVSCVPADRADILRTNRYSNSWAVEVHGGLIEADRLAEEHGFVNHGQIGNLEGYYHFQLLGAALKESGIHVRKRYLHPWQDEIGLEPLVTKALENNPMVGYVKQQQITRKTKRGYSPPTDPRFNDQWPVINTGQTCGPAGLDLNVEPAWLQGLDGTGVVVALVDDGLETTHPDLAPNYDAKASFDFVHNDSDPTPDENVDEPNSHGTECAGEIGMVKSNNNCGVGVAYKSQIGGVKFNGEATTDLIESLALSYRNEYIQVYSSSWGPLDDGFTVDGPERLLRHVFETSVKQGRNGKGSIYVWASGNGGGSDDSCAADGYSSSIYTISVGSADQNSGEPFYDEQCASKMAVAFSFNSDTFPSSPNSKVYKQVPTTTLHGRCVDDFTGTSASAPLVSAVIALCLQANSNITWRDVQYLIAYTSNPDILTDGEFSTNGAGLKVSHKFGFGAVDTEAMVTRAKRWITVPPQNSSIVYASYSSGKVYPNKPLTLTFNVTEENTSISYLEHIEITLSLTVENARTTYGLVDYKKYQLIAKSEEDIHKWLRDPHPRRGDIQVEITSPHNTTSILLPYRDFDFINDKGYINWPLMSVHHWGENPIGTWTLTVTFRSSSANVDMQDLQMTLYGTIEVPPSVSNIPKKCDSVCARSRGCSGAGPENCDVCSNYRIPSTLMCVNQCPNDTYKYKSRYCIDVYIEEVYSNKSASNGECTKGKPLSLTNVVLISVIVGVAGIVCLCCVISVGICCCVCCYRKRKHNRGSTYTMLRVDIGDDDPAPTPV